MRAAYIEIVKLVHPDSGRAEASAEKFAEVDNAFRILQEKYAKERHGINENPEVQEHDIKVNERRHVNVCKHNMDMIEVVLHCLFSTQQHNIGNIYLMTESVLVHPDNVRDNINSPERQKHTEK